MALIDAPMLTQWLPAGALTTLALTSTAAAQTCESQLFAADPSPVALFGASVHFDGAEIISGAPGDRDGANDAVGAAYILARATPSSPWTESAKLQPASLVPNDNFGAAVARDANTLAVGAPELASTLSAAPGQVYIFDRVSGTQWDEVAVLSPSDGDLRDTFGSALALEGDTLMVGAPGHDDPATPGGSVYVFERGPGGTWSLAQRIDKPQAFSGFGFGTTLALDGDLACIGGPALTITTPSAGGAFAFTRDAAGVWSLLETVQPTGLAIADRYAQAIELQNGTLAVGAPQHNGQVNDEGAVWIFEFDAVGATFGTPTKIAPTQVSMATRKGTFADS